jgi:hypothetical protein
VNAHQHKVSFPSNTIRQKQNNKIYVVSIKPGGPHGGKVGMTGVHLPQKVFIWTSMLYLISGMGI